MGFRVKVAGSGEVEVSDGSTAKELALKLGLTSAGQALAARINGVPRDLVYPLAEGDELAFLSFEDDAGKEIFWHTSAHVLAQAVLRLWPSAKLTIGPPIENGFYYDFANLHLSEADLSRIEEEMQAIARENYSCVREELSGKTEALQLFGDNAYKAEIIEQIPEGTSVTAYRQGDFSDLCRGPHLPSLGKIKAIKLLKTSGAYWRGDPANDVLTRIYGISFPDREQLKAYLTTVEEAKKRDHKVLGPRLDLFSTHELSPGMPFIHPKGMLVWNHLLDYWRQLHLAAGYVEIKTPSMMSRELWEVSGHWQHYRQNMYHCVIEERDFAVKPMNCPGCMLYYQGRLHSYREFPLRILELGHVHRYEAHGALSGLFRVRSFHQDDAHIFITRPQIRPEILAILQLADSIYTTFGLDYALELSTRPSEGTIGSDADWELATSGLQDALEQWGRPFKINPGEGAFYGPKIDIHIKDALNRRWQCGTIQLDMALPARFDLQYTEADGSRPRPILIHRALFGSIERFFGILIEHYAGRLPLWLSPRQIRILTVADRHADYAYELNTLFKKAGFSTEVDDSAESVSKKVRNAQLDQVNYILTVGDREVTQKTAALRTRDNVRLDELKLDLFLQKITAERESRSQTSAFAA
jgi:threonyl-tRNA synthetase